MNRVCDEHPVVFRCGTDELVGIVHRPAVPAQTGVLVIVGGPQYRVGSHRQFVLMARNLSAAGIPVMRFDCRGMGDSDGVGASFEFIDSDIRAAVDTFFEVEPELRRVVLWGLCGSACAGLLYGHRDDRVAGLVLVNPWVRTEEGWARAHLRHYYARRFADPAFWRHVLSGQFRLRESIASLAGMLATVQRGKRAPALPAADAIDGVGLPQRMLDGLRRFGGRVLVILSANDLVADEFADMVQRSPEWTQALLLAQAEQRTVRGADHTFTTLASHSEATAIVRTWLQSLPAIGATGQPIRLPPRHPAETQPVAWAAADMARGVTTTALR